MDAWTEEHKDEVLFYKPQGEVSDEYDFFKREDFCLIFMTSGQHSMLKQHGNDIICIDGTHGLNNYGFILYTLMVIDELRQGFPVAFMFSNLKSVHVYQIFFNSIKHALGQPVSPNVFMSDMEDSFYNAWSTVMGPVTHRLYCSWHVLRAWIGKSSIITNLQKKKEVQSRFQQLIKITCKSKFNKSMETFITDTKLDDDTAGFSDYFKLNYVRSKERWSYAYRVNAGINTNMCLENMHRVLKYFYLDGTKVKRLDKAIPALIALVEDMLFNRLIAQERGGYNHKVSKLRVSHKSSTSLAFDSIVQDGDDWLVKSSTSGVFYNIKKMNVKCPKEACTLRCEPCRTCIHIFNCACIDSCVKANMCKHIHLLVRFLNTKQDGGVDNLESAPSCSNIKSRLLSVLQEKPTKPKTNETTKQENENEKEFMEMIENVVKNKQYWSAMSTDAVKV